MNRAIASAIDGQRVKFPPSAFGVPATAGKLCWAFGVFFLAERLLFHRCRISASVVVMRTAFILFCASIISIAFGADPPITQDELIRRTQELCDAVAAGNPEPWKKYYADDCIYADEKGRTFDKKQLVADITPLPTGYSGVIKVENPQSRIMGDTAVLSYDLSESETIFGQELHARYHAIDTWLRRDNTWQIIATQAHRYYEDPAVGEANSEKFPQFAGTYELASGQVRTVLVENGNLVIERKGKKEQLYPEACDIFFRKGVEGRILFRHSPNGNVDTLIDRRNNEDVVWRKTK